MMEIMLVCVSAVAFVGPDRKRSEQEEVKRIS